MADLAFFYGTLMTGFDRRRRTGIDPKMRFLARGWVQAALFDLGIYPAAVPAQDARVWGEVFELLDPDDVLTALDEIEGYRPGDPTAACTSARSCRCIFLMAPARRRGRTSTTPRWARRRASYPGITWST
jgi:gamma-glutamylcyclotransferase (GGCT)/AIG2-like uncharacterized protein YtfP